MRAIDLFCGTGGFSLGAARAGFDVIAAFDIDPNLTSSHKLNFSKTRLFLQDIGKLSGSEIKQTFGGPFDLIIGGPPCQGFSMMGNRDRNDPRRSLLSDFFRLVAEVRPRAFVMENVEGLLIGDARSVLDDALRHVGDYEVLEPLVLDASDFGAPTKRRRIFLVGYLPDQCSTINCDMFSPDDCVRATVRDALSGLSSCSEVKATTPGFDLFKIPSGQKLSPYAQRLASPDRTFTGNQRTKHSQAVVDRFATVRQGKADPIGKHHRLKLDGVCPTLRAGTGSDKGSFQSVRPIHPLEDRVITVREAARLQGFPDKHIFHSTIWHSFRQIGNSVSPIIAEQILSVVYKALNR